MKKTLHLRSNEFAPKFDFPSLPRRGRPPACAGLPKNEVSNPAEINPDQTMGWEQCMRRDIPSW